MATLSNTISPNRKANLRRYNSGDKGRAAQGRFDELHPGERSAYVAKHYETHPDRLIVKRARDRKQQAARYHANPELMKLKAAESLRRNPETKRSIDHRRRAKLWKAEGTHTKADLKEIWERQDGRCDICKEKCWRGTSPDRSHARKWTIDHIHPISRGGTEWPSNLRGLCLSCNAAKRDRLAIS
jgi:5-methylcytosine-specific restriction endonuclease McrA